MRTILVLAVALSITAACSKKGVSRESAEAACDHQIELGFWQGFDSSIRTQKLDPADPAVKKQGVAALAEQRATPEWKAARDKCVGPFTEHATEKQITCVMAATTVEAAQACL